MWRLKLSYKENLVVFVKLTHFIIHLTLGHYHSLPIFISDPNYASKVKLSQENGLNNLPKRKTKSLHPISLFNMHN